jgi:Arc/MetJ-type ribon-helix-helix transcriptional regulator
MSHVLGKVCTACGQERKQKDKLAYRPETFEAYCVSYYFCNEEHPNSPKNILKNQGETILISYEEAKEKYEEWLEANHENPEKVKRIRKMVEAPMTLRLNSPDMAAFILDLQQEMQFTSISDTIRFCIQRMQEEHGGFHKQQAEIKQVQKEEENLKAFTSPVTVQPKTETVKPVSEDLFSF